MFWLFVALSCHVLVLVPRVEVPAASPVAPPRHLLSPGPGRKTVAPRHAPNGVTHDNLSFLWLVLPPHGKSLKCCVILYQVIYTTIRTTSYVVTAGHGRNQIRPSTAVRRLLLFTTHHSPLTD